MSRQHRGRGGDMHESREQDRRPGPAHRVARRAEDGQREGEHCLFDGSRADLSE